MKTKNRIVRIVTTTAVSICNTVRSGCPSRKILLATIACLFLFPTLRAQAAGEYPDHAIHWVVPWPPGGGADLLARMLVPNVAKILGQAVVIDNRGGAGGNIGAAYGARAAPDGYTITFAYSATHSINPLVYSEMPFKESDFEPVIFLSLVPQMLVVNPQLPVHNVQEFIALSKKRQLTFASSGEGSIGHLGGELFASMTGANMLHVPYRGGGPAMVAALSGQVDALLGVPLVLAAQVKAGKLRAIGITTAKRTNVLPDVPTIAEQAVPGFDVSSWNGVLVPAKTPAAIIAKLNKAFNEAMAEPELHKHLVAEGYEIVGGKPAAFSKFIDSELAKWAPVVKKIDLHVN